MSTAAASKETGHPVEVECPCCSHRFRVPLPVLSTGVRLLCQGCNCDIPIATSTLRQLLREIDKDLRTPDDLPIFLRPAKGHPFATHDVDKDKTETG
jgi:hypothetical protein